MNLVSSVDDACINNNAMWEPHDLNLAEDS